uniref:Uncharacterized protein n=1 Tax=Mantoniella antarctica TaxID=81844 RepID=A0A7S0X2V7_9CHLO
MQVRRGVGVTAATGGGAGDGSGVQKDRQSLRFKDSRTGVDVVLVGTMHYNPASIHLAASTVRGLSEADDLAAIVLETCPSRWAKTLKMQPKNALMRKLLDNEFQAATEVAEPDVRIVLGDQRIEDLSVSAKAVLKLTWEEFTNPLGGGWARLLANWQAGYAREVAGVPGAGLTAGDLLFDWRLALCMPVSLFRYPLAWALKSPKVIIPFAAFVFGLEQLPGLVPQGAVDVASGAYVATAPETAVSALFLVLDVLQVVFLSQLFLKALLEVRNDILARSIRTACQDAIAASAAAGAGSDDEVGAVVAILGAAHLNGVQYRLMEGEEDVGGGGGDAAWWIEETAATERAAGAALPP